MYMTINLSFAHDNISKVTTHPHLYMNLDFPKRAIHFRGKISNRNVDELSIYSSTVEIVVNYLL